MLLWHHRYISKDDKNSAAGLLDKVVERFREELESSLVLHLVYMYASEFLSSMWCFSNFAKDLKPLQIISALNDPRL